MLRIQTIDSPEEKSSICSTVLHSLPEWFGIETSIVKYIDKLEIMK